MKDRRSGLPAERVAYWLAVAFLLTPGILFAVTWLRQPLGLICASGLLVTAWRASALFRSLASQGETLTARELAVVAFASVALCAFFGIGGFGYQTVDWVKHNLLMQQLIANPWPFTLSMDGKHYAISYYVAFHLLSGLAGKIGGWTLANFVALLHASSGLAAVILLVRTISRARLVVVLLSMLLLTGLDIIPSVVLRVLGVGMRGEWWAAAFQYSHNLNLLLFVPNQAIAGWLGAAILVIGHQRGRLVSAAAFSVAAVMLWSPLVAIGLALLALLLMLLTADQGIVRLRAIGESLTLIWKARLDLTAALFGALPIAAVYLNKMSLDERPFDPLQQAEPYFASITSLDNSGLIAVAYVAFVIVEFLLLVTILAFRREWQEQSFLPVLAASSVVLCVVPLVRFGFFNDFAMRASISPLFCLAIISAAAFTRGNRGTRRLLGGYALIAGSGGAAMAALEMRPALAAGWRAEIASTQRYDPVCVHRRYLRVERQNFLPQYLGPYEEGGISSYLFAAPAADVPLDLRRPRACPEKGYR